MKSKKPGPDPKPAARLHGRCVMVRLTPADYAQLKREAMAAGLSLSSYLVRRWKG
jgi:hypothetical protein